MHLQVKLKKVPHQTIKQMASVRVLKKEISYLSSQLIADCFDFLNNYEDVNSITILSIIDEAVSLNNSIVDRICHPTDKKNPKLTREYYKNIRIDFIKGLDTSYGKLESMIKD